MSSGYESNGVDLDSIFAAYVAGHSQASATGIQVSGIDLNSRYEQLSYGTSASATGYDSKGADLNTIFAAKGTTWLPAIAGSSVIQGPVGGTPNILTQSPQFVADAAHKTVSSYSWTVTKTGGTGSVAIGGGQGTDHALVTVTVTYPNSVQYSIYCTITVGSGILNTATLNCTGTALSTNNHDNASAIVGATSQSAAILTSTGSATAISIAKSLASDFNSFNWTIFNIRSNDGSGTATISGSTTGSSITVDATIPTNGWTSFQYSCSCVSSSSGSTNIAGGGVICEY